MPFYLQMSTNINSTTRHLRFSYILILTNLIYIKNNKIDSMISKENVVALKNNGMLSDDIINTLQRICLTESVQM